MNKKRIYPALHLDKKELDKAISLGAQAIVAYEISVSVPAGIEVIDANEYRAAGSHRAFDANLRLYEAELSKSWSSAFIFRGVPLWDAYLKALLWSNQRLAYIEEAIAQLGPDVHILKRIPLHSGSRWRCALAMGKAMLRKLLGGAYQVPVFKLPDYARLGFLIRNSFEYRLVERLHKAFNKESVLVLPPNHGFKTEEIEKLQTEGHKIILCPDSNWSHIPWSIPFRFGGSKAWFVRQMLRNEPGISACLSWGKGLMDSPLRVFITVAQENTPYGHILGRMAEATGKHVINVMNGIKGGLANDRLVQFQSWIMWDQAMQNLLLKHCGLSKERLFIAGHLGRDNVYGHTYTGAIPVNEVERSEKRIVSIISTKDLRYEKVAALTALYNWASQQNDVILLYRPHPSEKEESYYLPDSSLGIDLRLIKPEQAIAKTSLFDQLLSSDLTINFGSTVSMEALWIKARCVTFEMKPESLLYCVDGLNLKHISSPEALRAELDSCIFHIKENRVNNNEEDIPSWQKHADYIRPLILA